MPGTQISVSGLTDTTDEYGQARMILPLGKHTVSVTAPGCIARNVTITITAGENKIPMIGVSDEPLYEVELKPHEMTLDEIIAAGIDTQAKENQHVYRYEMRLDFEPEVDWLSIAYYWGDTTGLIDADAHNSDAPDNPNGQNDPNAPGESRDRNWIWIPSMGPNSPPPHIYVPPSNTRPPLSIYPVSENFYLIIRGEVQWLKEMFDVEMLVVRKTKSDTMENLTATLTLPEGLSLATMLEGEQEFSQKLDDLVGEKMSTSVHWYVRGDTAGSYDVSARLQGIMMPFGDEIDALFLGQNQLQVLAGSAMHLNFEFPSTAYYGEDYPITITLENVSEKPIYNISHKIQIVQGMEYYYDDGTSKEKIETSKWFSSGVVREFRPHDKIIMEASVNIFFESEIMTQKLEKMIGVVNSVEELVKGCKALKDARDTVEDLNDLFENSSKSIDKFLNESVVDQSAKSTLFGDLGKELFGFLTSHAKSVDDAIDAGAVVMQSVVYPTLQSIIVNPEEWYGSHSAENIMELISQIQSVGEKIRNRQEFDIYDSIRTAISAIPIVFILKDAIMSEDENNTTSIPWSYTALPQTPHYFGVANVSKYLQSIAKAVKAQLVDDVMTNVTDVLFDIAGIRFISGGVYKYIPGMDPFDDEAIKYILATNHEINTFQAKDATGEVTFRAWLETADGDKVKLASADMLDFELSCDNSTAVLENNVLTFTGEGLISVRPLSHEDAVLHVEDTHGNQYIWRMEVVEPHTCTAEERRVILPAREGHDGFAVKGCNVCGELMEINTLVYEDYCSEHSFGEWQTESEATATAAGLQCRACSVCGKTEYQFTPTISTDSITLYCQTCQRNKEDVFLALTIGNPSSSNLSVQLVAASYNNDGKMLSCSIIPDVTLAANSEVEESIRVDCQGNGDTATVKLFFVDDNWVPLASSMTMPRFSIISAK